MTVPTLRCRFDNSWKKIAIFIPFIWPKRFEVKIYFLLALVGLVVSSTISIYIPIYSKKIVDSLIGKDGIEADFRWDLICIYSLLRYMKNMENLKQMFWDRVEQNISQELESHVFQHIQELSMRWHLNRKTGEVIEIMARSRYALGALIDLGFLNIIPLTFDIIFIVGYFTLLVNIWFSIFISAGLMLYFVFLIKGREEMSELRKEEVEAAYKLKDKSIDSLLNFETVKYFGNERYEVGAFQKALSRLYDSEFLKSKTYSVHQAREYLLTDLTLLIATLICVYNVVKSEKLTVGDYVMFCDYFTQIYGSVNYFGYIYKSIGDYFSRVENLYDLLLEKPEVMDSPDAKVLEINGGTIEFKNVFFEYLENQPILKNITFSVPPGQTIAVVGPSGSGKSTIVRLIFRFYDVISGSILIDGQNVKDVTQESLRKAIGVVPQDTVLFNDSIRYNICYGGLQATEDEIVEAAKAADLHDSIMSFKNGYDTEVGERGLRLSGGEKQRVAIARTLLKAPEIVLLDEATSALDTKTERNIQESLRRVCTNRTTLMIAHRLSTIIHADQIIVLKEGIIVERGRHEELLEKDGLYASMWKLQLETGNP